MLPDDRDHGFTSRPWTGQDVVMVHRFDQMWSTWRWLTSAGEWVPGSYINLERTWLLGEGVYETEDLTLDVVISADGSLSFKDEDELDWLETVGLCTGSDADAIRAIGQRAHEHFSSHGWPLDVSWDAWLPGPSRRPPELPSGWEAMPSLASDGSGHPAAEPHSG